MLRKKPAKQSSVVPAKPLEEDSTTTFSTPRPPRSVSCSEFDYRPLRRWPTSRAQRGKREELIFIRVRDSHSRSIVKAVSWRVTGSVDTFVLSFVFTGSIKVAGSIAGAEAITKMILYYLHERAWSFIRWDQQGHAGDGSSTT
jgi:uncharacterized membrane protein